MLVAVQTDRGLGPRDASGRLLAYLDAEDDLPPIAGGQTYDLGRVQVLAGNAPIVADLRFARQGSYAAAEQTAYAEARGLWNACGGEPA